MNLYESQAQHEGYKGNCHPHETGLKHPGIAVEREVAKYRNISIANQGEGIEILCISRYSSQEDRGDVIWQESHLSGMDPYRNARFGETVSALCFETFKQYS